MIEFHFWRTSLNRNLIIDLDAHWINNHTRQILQRFELLSWPLLIPTLEKPHDRVSLLRSFSKFKFAHTWSNQGLKACIFSFKEILSKIEWWSFNLTKFSELKFDHRFGCPFDIKTCTPTFAMVQAILTPSSPTLAKMNGGVSLLTNFLELKFDHRFGCLFDR